MFEIEDVPITTLKGNTGDFLQEALEVIKKLDSNGKNSVFIPVGLYGSPYQLRSSLNTTLQRAAIKYISRTEIKYECDDHGKFTSNREKYCCNKCKKTVTGLRIWRKP